MANNATNKVSTDTRHINQGARPTERDENSRINTVPTPSDPKSKGQAVVTHNSENKRIATVVLP
jgi:hypothetical protein